MSSIDFFPSPGSSPGSHIAFSCPVDLHHFLWTLALGMLNPRSLHTHQESSEMGACRKTHSWACAQGCCLRHPPAHQLSQAPLHVFVPQAVDKRVQHGGQNCVDDRCHPVLDGVGGQGPEINVNNASIKECHHGEVGATGGESFMLPSCWRDLKNSRENP